MHGMDEHDEINYWRERARAAERKTRDQSSVIGNIQQDLTLAHSALHVETSRHQETKARLSAVAAARGAAEREADRWRHGKTIEGDYVCPRGLECDAAIAALARVTAARDELASIADLRWQEDPGRRECEDKRISELKAVK